MCDGWHVISKASSELPEWGQEIYCCIADDDSISAVKKAVTDLTYFEELLYLHPAWLIFWQPLPPLPKPPSLSAVNSCRKEDAHGKHTH